MLKQADRPLYAEACWETFQQKHQPGRLTMSSAEFQEITRWMDREIPLMIALRGIEETGGSPRTMLACEGPVARAFEYYVQAMGLMPAGGHAHYTEEG